MKTIEELRHFLDVEVFNLLENFTDDVAPKWGSMDARQMVEHMPLAIQVASGKRVLTLASPADKVEKIKNIALLSDRPLQKGFKNVALPDGPLEHIHPNLEVAIVALKQEMEDFHQSFADNVEQKRLHNVFGELNYQEWLWFHYKHFIHHFSQFGLLPEVERIS
jgi:hypothetical protein